MTYKYTKRYHYPYFKYPLPFRQITKPQERLNLFKIVAKDFGRVNGNIMDLFELYWEETVNKDELMRLSSLNEKENGRYSNICMALLKLMFSGEEEGKVPKFVNFFYKWLMRILRVYGVSPEDLSDDELACFWTFYYMTCYKCRNRRRRRRWMRYTKS